AAEALVAAGPDAELEAVPGADDVGLDGIIFEGAGSAVVGHRLGDPLHDAALADRPGAMGAAVMPREELVADPEHADLKLSAIDNLAIAVGVVDHLACGIFGHASLPAWNATCPKEAPPDGTCQSGSAAGTAKRGRQCFASSVARPCSPAIFTSSLPHWKSRAISSAALWASSLGFGLARTSI